MPLTNPDLRAKAYDVYVPFLKDILHEQRAFKRGGCLTEWIEGSILQRLKPLSKSGEEPPITKCVPHGEWKVVLNRIYGKVGDKRTDENDRRYEHVARNRRLVALHFSRHDALACRNYSELLDQVPNKDGSKRKSRKPFRAGRGNPKTDKILNQNTLKSKIDDLLKDSFKIKTELPKMPDRYDKIQEFQQQLARHLSDLDSTITNLKAVRGIIETLQAELAEHLAMKTEMKA